jgi:8-oxo-dGTP pyrophosphatase MutT (NUDIX family)
VSDNTYSVRRREERFRGPVFSVLTDEVAMPGGGYARRDYVLHLGAVAVVALDDADRVVLVRQYRHPVGERLWELPAGLVDVDDEPPLETAARELAEEADLAAGRWELLVDAYTSPGYSNELIRLFLARDLTPVPVDNRHQRHDEEAELVIRLVDLDEAVAMALRGEIINATCLIGVFAAASLRARGWPPLRPADSPPVRPRLAAADGR